MFLFHRLLNLTTMMYQEQDELTVVHYLRAQDRENIAKSGEERAGQQERKRDPPKPTENKAKPTTKQQANNPSSSSSSSSAQRTQQQNAASSSSINHATTQDNRQEDTVDDQVPVDLGDFGREQDVTMGNQNPNPAYFAQNPVICNDGVNQGTYNQGGQLSELH